jgi:hypothetical protein
VDTTEIGRTIASERFPNTMDSFWFTVRNNVLVSPFDFVTADNLYDTKTIGIIKELQAVDNMAYHNNDLSIHTKNETVRSVDIDRSIGIMLGKAAIMGNTGLKSDGLKFSVSVSVPVGVNRLVKFSTKEEIVYALGIPDMKIPIPAGIVQTSNGIQIPISLDASYILGPDTTNVNASRISGNLKTSYLLFLLQSAYQKLKEEGEDLALVIFNTKEEDLLHLHKKEKDIKEGTKKVFHILDLELDPFENVTYFLPRGKDGRPNSIHVPKNSNIYSYELEDIYDKLDLLFAEIDDPRYNLSSITDYIYESWPMTKSSSGKKVQTWTDLFGFRDYPQSIISHKSSLLRFLGHLQRFRKSPLFIDKRAKSIYIGEVLEKIKSHHVFVIDIAMISSVEEQAFIIADVMRAIDQMYTSRFLHYNNDRYTGYSGKRLPNYILIFIDEINRFLPTTQPLARINSAAEQIMRTLIAGGSRGTILFSAQQFKTATDFRLHENTGLHVIAKLGLSELSAQPYSMLDESTKRNITRLNRGELVMIHPAFRHPIKILFPRASFIKH